MNDPTPIAETAALAERSLRFAGGVFDDMAATRDVRQCRDAARMAREQAATSAYPLLCLARAAWWAAVADRLTPTASAPTPSVPRPDRWRRA